MKNLLTLLFMLPVAVSWGQDSFSLEQALQFAYENNIDLQNAEVDEELIEAQKKEIIGIGLPQLEASLDVKDFIQIPTSLIPADAFGGPPGEFIAVQFGTQYNADFGFSASQIIFSGDYVVALQSSGEFLELAKKNTKRTQIDIAEKVSKAYYNVLINEDLLDLIDANIVQLESLLNNTQGLYEEGFVEQIDVDRIQVAYNNLKTEKDKMSRVYALSKNLLKFQMNYDLSKEITLSGTLDDILITEATVTTGESHTNRIEWSLLDSQTRIAHLAVKKDKYAYLPTLVAYGSLSAQALRNEFDIFDPSQRWYSTGLVGAKLSIPLYSGFQRRYKLEQSKLELVKLNHQSELLKAGINLEISNAEIALTNSLETVSDQEKNVELAQSIYDTVIKKYEEGVGSNLEVIDAETSLKTAQNNYYTALYDAIIAQIDLKKAKGLLIQ